MNGCGYFNISLNEDQAERLRAAGFEGFAENTDDLLFYVYHTLDRLAHHNKNYTKTQYYGITALYDIFEAIYKGF